MAAHTTLGYILAVGLAGVAHGQMADNAIAGIAVWVVLLNGGTLALNSAFDRDEGDIGYLKAPPPVPDGLAAFGMGMLVLGQALAFLLPLGYALAYAMCLLLSVLYSAPPFRLKAVTGADWAINMVGFGVLTPWAGWSLTGLPLDSAHLLVLLAFCPLFAALYPLTQLYQFEEDRRRGDRTLALVLGLRRSLLVAIAAAAIAFGLFLAAAVMGDWGGKGRDVLRWLALAGAAVAWGAVLLPWYRRAPEMEPAGHQRGMYRALMAWAVTDVVVVLAWG